MDNLITGALAVGVFVAFSAGLAQSIGAIPFVLIVTIVIAVVVYDFWESARKGLREEQEQEQKAGKE